MSIFGFKGADSVTPLREWLPALREVGFSWMEIRAPETPDAEWEEQLREWHRDGWVFAVHARFFGINLSSPNPRVRKAAVEVALEDLAFARRIGARRLNLHAGDVNWYDVPPPDHPAHGWMMEALNRLRERHLAAAAQSVTEIARAAQRQGIEVVVENLYKPWDLLCTPQEVREFLAGADGSVGFTLDTGHARVAGWSPTAFLRELNGRIRHLHLHWNDGVFDTHDFPDTSIPDLAEFLQTVAGCCPSATLLVEITPDSAEKVERFLRWPAQVHAVMESVFGNDKEVCMDQLARGSV